MNPASQNTLFGRVAKDPANGSQPAHSGGSRSLQGVAHSDATIQFAGTGERSGCPPGQFRLARRAAGGWSGLSRRSGDVGGDDVGGVPVQGRPGPVVSNGGPRIGVGGGFLYVA